LARVRNPHVSTVHQIIDAEPFPWIVMELVPGRTLAAILAEGTLPPAEAASIGRDVAEALTAAHEVGVLHRDVKPANVLVRPDGRAVLVDFGIAAVEGSATVTATGSVVGTMEYVAPERTLGRLPTPASDLWSLGVLLYVAVEGHSPFRRPNQWATLAAIVNDPHPPPRMAGDLADLLDALLAKDPAERPDGATVLAHLAAIAEPDRPRRPTPLPPLTHRAAAAIPPPPATADAAGPAPGDIPTVTAGPPPRPTSAPSVGPVPGPTPPAGPLPATPASPPAPAATSG
jgi:serine/threonine protein kinase